MITKVVRAVPYDGPAPATGTTMARYIGERLDWLLEVVSEEFRSDRDVRVGAISGWEKRGSVESDVWRFEPRGVMDHDTGSAIGSRYSSVRDWCWKGSPDAPLCQMITSSPWAPDTPDYVQIDILASGRCNHAGRGSYPPWLTNSSNTVSTVGNHKSIGIEHFWTPEHERKGGVHPLHLETQLRLDACILEHLGLPATRQVDHKEYARFDDGRLGRKVDRRYVSPNYRTALADLMAQRAQAPGEDMPLTPDEIAAVARETTRQVLTMLTDSANAESIVRQWMQTTYTEFPPGTGPGGERRPLSVSAALYAAEAFARKAAADAAVARVVAEQLAKGVILTDAEVARIADEVEAEFANGVVVEGSISWQEGK